MSIKRLIWCFLLVGSSLLAKAEGNIMFEQANALYHSKNYDSAAQLYTQLIQKGYCSDDLYYNTGNAFYKAQKIGWAVWAYRKSMQIHCDKNTLDNYRLAKKEIQNPLLEQKEIFFIRWWRSLYTLFTVNVWAIIALLSFITFLAIFFFQLVKKRNIPSLVRYSFLGLFLISLFMMFIRYHTEANHYEAVLVDATYFEDANSKQQEKIPEGSEIRIVDKEPATQKGKVLVQLSDLRRGFIAKQAMKRL